MLRVFRSNRSCFHTEGTEELRKCPTTLVSLVNLWLFWRATLLLVTIFHLKSEGILHHSQNVGSAGKAWRL